jgi:uncharacterized repeat protein (TIGR01451 family)
VRSKQLFISLTLGLGLTLVLLWLLGGATLPAAYAAPPQCPGQRPLLQAGDVITVCLSGDCDYASIQDAVDAADSSDEILVATGTYTGVGARAGVTQVVYISKSVTIQGGYNADFSAWDPDTYSTTLDAQGQGRVLYIIGSISPTIEGLRITCGDATALSGSPGGNAGGGVYVITATATIKDNLIISNTADSYGGGLYIASSAATLVSNTVMANAAGEDDYGGGLCLVGSDATLNSNTFISNTAHGGGGLVLAYSAATLHGNTISYNTADGGGGLDLVASNATLSNNIVISNTAYLWGGGLYVDQSSNATLVNNVVADNRADSQGSGLYIRGSSPHLLHNTIARNTGGDGSGVYVTNFGADYSTVAFTNTILASHTVGITVTGGNTVTLEATLWANDTDWGGVGNIFTGTVNVWGAPAFVNPNAGDYHIAAVSVARDAGVNAGVTEDFEGESRPSDGFYDIGADEYYPHPVLSVSQQAVPGLVQGGAPLTYTIHVANTGNVTLTATITDTLPEHVTTTQPLVWASQVIPAPGGVWAGTVVVTVELDYTGPLINVVQVTTEEGATGVYTETVTSGYQIYLPLLMRQYQ